MLLSNCGEMNIVLAGFKLNYNHKHDLAAIIESQVLNVYRTELINIGDTVLDLGAGIGDFALLASEKVGPNGKAIAIEPSPDDYQCLLNNIKANNCENIHPINMAVADFEGVIDLEFKVKKFKSKCRSLPDILKDVNYDKIDFVKMDIEDAEKNVIPQNITIFRNIRYLSLEIQNGYQNQLIQFMYDLGFVFCRISKRKHLWNALRFTAKNLIKSYDLIKLLKKAGEYPGYKKIMDGIEIEGSDNLVVGTFTNRNVSN